MSTLSGDFVISRLKAIMPEQETVSLFSLQDNANPASSGVSWTANRQQANIDDLWSAGLEGTDNAIIFELWKEGQTTDPNVLDKVTDAGGVSWTIKHVNPKQMFQRTFRCTCIRYV